MQERERKTNVEREKHKLQGDGEKTCMQITSNNIKYSGWYEQPNKQNQMGKMRWKINATRKQESQKVSRAQKQKDG
jgi:hypothetical protein